MDPKLKKLDAMAGLPNTLFALSIPITNAASETSRMNGNMMRVSWAVKAALCGLNPGARTLTSWLENTMPAMHRAPSTSTVSVATLFASRHAAPSPWRAMVLLKVVTKARRQRTLREQVAQQIRNAERRGEGVHRAAAAE